MLLVEGRKSAMGMTRDPLLVSGVCVLLLANSGAEAMKWTPPKITLQWAIRERKTPQSSLGGWRGDNVEDYRRGRGAEDGHLGTRLRTCACTRANLRFQSFALKVLSCKSTKVHPSLLVRGAARKWARAHARAQMRSHARSMLTRSRS